MTPYPEKPMPNPSNPKPQSSAQSNTSRRNFFRGSAATLAAAAAIPLEPLIAPKNSSAAASTVPWKSGKRAKASLHYRTVAAQAAEKDAGVLPDNGDAARFHDFSFAHTKALQHDALGLPNKDSVRSLIKALTTGDHDDFEQILMGTPGGGGNSKLNGPQTSLAFDLEGLDSHAIEIPPAPSVASAQTAAEQVEHYWGALLRDVNFADYSTSPLAAQAAQDLNRLSFLRGSANNEFPYPVTPQNLFRGQFVPGDGNVQGPYISQLMIQPTFFGAQPLGQQYQTFLPISGGGSDFLTSVNEFQLVQNGGDSGRKLAIDPQVRFIRNGRDLAAFTHVDVLYQAFFTGFLVMAGLGVPLNPGNPYNHSETQKAFGTLGGPDAAGTLAEVATRALKAAWFHKYIVNLRLRPEEYGALVHARLANLTPLPMAAAALHADVLSSAALPLINSANGSYLLPQAFPEGSPTHPCYPTGHGTVAGACITVIKLFFDASQKVRPFLNHAGRDVSVPAADGLSLQPYTGSDRDALDFNGELNKLAHNISFGHGIHSGIHFRSSTYSSILLGEKVALSILKDRAKSYNEPFRLNITLFDGTQTTIEN
jgi:hypothetical protein